MSAEHYYLNLNHAKDKLYALFGHVQERKHRAAILNPGDPCRILWDETKHEIGDILDWIKTQEVRSAASDEVKTAWGNLDLAQYSGQYHEERATGFPLDGVGERQGDSH